MDAQSTEAPQARRPKEYPVRFSVRCTEAENRLLARRAKRARRSISRFLVELGTAEAAERVLPPRPSEEELEVLEGLMYQVRKIGINLNQLAHRENSADAGGGAEPPSDAELREAARAIQEVVRVIRDRLR